MLATLRRRQAVAASLLVLLVLASGIVVFVGFFVGAYVVLAICVTMIVSGRPPKKLSFGLLAYEQAGLEKAVDALSEGGTALQAVEAEVRGLQ